MQDEQPGIEDALEELVGPETRGDPCSPLKWTTKSLGNLVRGLSARGFAASKRTVARLLKQADYRLQATFKTKEGSQHPDRDAQFGHINATAAEFLAAGDPVASIDAKKKGNWSSLKGAGLVNPLVRGLCSGFCPFPGSVRAYAVEGSVSRLDRRSTPKGPWP